MRRAAVLVVVAGVLAIVGACAIVTQPYPQASGALPQVVSCVPQNPDYQASANWQPTLRVQVEPGRDPGRVREYRVLGCTLYYYHYHLQ